MSEMAKNARAAMAAKAKKMASTKDERVDASTWTQGEPMHPEVKTGMRPISKRQFKRGGKIAGETCEARADRKPRKSGGRALTADSLINRDQKEANRDRDGIKHIGGMKRGGTTNRPHHAKGGVPDYDTGSRTGAGAVTRDAPKSSNIPMPPRREVEDYDTGSRTGEGAVTRDAEKRGGRAKKMDGGQMGYQNPLLTGAQKLVANNAGAAVPNRLMTPAGKAGVSVMPYKKGGKAMGHDDEAEDRALVKKMVKHGSLTGKKHGGTADGFDKKNPGGTRPTGGRLARATGGKAGKGKTHINILISAGGKDGQPGGQMPMGAPQGQMPPMPPPPHPPMGGPQGGPPGMPPMGMPPGPPMMPPGAGGPPMGRKAGGRVHRSYKDMDAGSGGGEGRLEKTEIQKRKESA